MSAAVIGIKGASVVMTPIEKLEAAEETDWANRRPKDAHWTNMSKIVDILGGRPAYPLRELALTGLLAKDAKRGLIPE